MAGNRYGRDESKSSYDGLFESAMPATNIHDIGTELNQLGNEFANVRCNLLNSKFSHLQEHSPAQSQLSPHHSQQQQQLHSQPISRQQSQHSDPSTQTNTKTSKNHEFFSQEKPKNTNNITHHTGHDDKSEETSELSVLSAAIEQRLKQLKLRLNELENDSSNDNLIDSSMDGIRTANGNYLDSNSDKKTDLNGNYYDNSNNTTNNKGILSDLDKGENIMQNYDYNFNYSNGNNIDSNYGVSNGVSDDISNQLREYLDEQRQISITKDAILKNRHKMDNPMREVEHTVSRIVKKAERLFGIEDLNDTSKINLIRPKSDLQTTNNSINAPNGVSNANANINNINNINASSLITDSNSYSSQLENEIDATWNRMQLMLEKCRAVNHPFNKMDGSNE